MVKKNGSILMEASIHREFHRVNNIKSTSSRLSSLRAHWITHLEKGYYIRYSYFIVCIATHYNELHNGRKINRFILPFFFSIFMSISVYEMYFIDDAWSFEKKNERHGPSVPFV